MKRATNKTRNARGKLSGKQLAAMGFVDDAEYLLAVETHGLDRAQVVALLEVYRRWVALLERSAALAEPSAAVRGFQLN